MRRAGPLFRAQKKTSTGSRESRAGRERDIYVSTFLGAAGPKPARRLDAVGELYTIGVFTGLGVSLGVVAAALLGGIRFGLPLAAALGAAAGGALGFALAGAEEAVGGAVGGVAGAVGAGVLVRGALTRGGARIATGALLVVAALVLAVLALVPALGYIQAVALPLIARRLRRSESRRYAGLRILARD